MSTVAEPATPLEGLRAWAARTPDEVALGDDRSALTYAELLERIEAEVTARQRTAVAGEAFVPVPVQRSVGSAVAILACLLGRIPFFPVDAGSSTVLRDSLAARARVADAQFPGVADEPGLVVFTSGTTGTPKGVVMSWETLDRRWRYRDGLARSREGGFRQPLVAPLDSAWGVQLLADVASGASVHIVDVGRQRPADLLGMLADFEPTDMVLPSQLARIWSQLPERSVRRLPTVRRLGVGSEAFRYEYLAGLRSFFDDDVTVAHNLSTTEAGRILRNEFALGRAEASGVVRVGRPVFPEHVRLDPVEGMGDEGVAVLEVYAGGAIASGYLGNQELTEQRFPVDDTGRRWWKSGDLVSLEHDGTYRHRGRIDDIVKVRGRLASPSDVTAVLQQVEGIRMAITIPVVDDGNTRLVSHVELQPGSTLRLSEVKEVLTDRLPPYLVPTAVMRHARLPINRRGKVDRKLLMEGPFESW